MSVNNRKIPSNNENMLDDLTENHLASNEESANNQEMTTDDSDSEINTTETIIVKPANSANVDNTNTDSTKKIDIKTSDNSISDSDSLTSDVAKKSTLKGSKIKSIDTMATEDSTDNRDDDSEIVSPDPLPLSTKESIQPTDVSLVCENKKVAESVAPEKRSSKWGYQVVLVLFLIIAFTAVMAYQTFFGKLNREQSEMVVEDGQSYYGLLPQFQKDIPMFSVMLAKIYIKYGVTAPLDAGVYDMPANPNLQEFLHALQHAQELEVVAIQVIEGKRAQDLYTAVANTPQITLEVLSTDGKPIDNLKEALGIDATTPEGKYSDNLEGWFTPDTYHYNEGTTDKQVLIDLYNSQRQALDTAWENRAADLPYETPYEALIMASIIEKETSVPSERELVSAVFVNRLNKGMRLQTDPTIIYGMGERYDGDIRRRDIDEKTDYNTYQIDGLPPTPIALPSHASIEAAMHPADDDALYFVATGTGGHTFTKTLAEHNRAVQEYRRVMREKQ